MFTITGLWLATYLNLSIVWSLPQECINNRWAGCYYPGDNYFFVSKDYDEYWTNRIEVHEIGHYCYSKLYNDMSEESASDFENFLTEGKIKYDKEYYIKLIKDCR